MQIAVIGTGYVGLVTGTCFAEYGFDVTCVDIDRKKIDGLNQEETVLPIYEPGLEELVKQNKKAGRLHFTTSLKDAVEKALVVFIAVGTPPKKDGDAELEYHEADLRFVEEVARSIGETMNGQYKVVVTKSTVPVGTGERVRGWILENQKVKTEFGVVSNPEFLREGVAIDDFMKPERIIVGSRDQQAIDIMKDLYRPLQQEEDTTLVITTLEAAELIKYASNAFLATKISFINEIANLCDRVGCDVKDVAKGMGLDKRIGPHFLHPGPGYGGSCFPKDTSALVAIAKQYGSETQIVKAAIDVNKRQREEMVAKIKSLVGDLKGKTIGILGLAFKPETDDMREAPAIDIIHQLVEGGANVRAYDPVAMAEAKKVLPPITYVTDEFAAATGADVLVVMTEWRHFYNLDMAEIKKRMKSPKLADLRNVFKPKEMRELGFEYVGVGRTTAKVSIKQIAV